MPETVDYLIIGGGVAGGRGKEERVDGVELDGGDVIPADFVTAGVRIIPNMGLAEKAGLKMDGGIVVDEHLKTSAEGVYAGGDVARFCSPIFKRFLRVEGVDVAQKQGAVAGKNMADRKESLDELPYFSNQFDLEINAFGDLSQHTAVVRRRLLDSKKGFIQFYFNRLILDGVLSVNADRKETEGAKALVQSRRRYTNPSVFSDESKSLRSLGRSA